MWQFSAPCYHFSIEMHTNFFFFSFLFSVSMESYQVKNTAHTQYYQWGGAVACGRWRCLCHHPLAVLELPWPHCSTKEGIQLWSDTLRHVAKARCFKRDHWKCILVLYLPLSACPSQCLSLSFLMCSTGRHKTDKCMWLHTHVRRSKVRVHSVWVISFPLDYTVLLIWSN